MVSMRPDYELLKKFTDLFFKFQAVFNMSYLTEHEAIYHMNKIVLPLVKADVVSVEKSKGAGKKPTSGKTAAKGKK